MGSALYKDAKKEYPLLSDVYRRKKELQAQGQEVAFQTKLQLAKAQLALLRTLGVKTKTVVFGCWYFAKHLVKFLARLGLDWVTRAQVNWLVRYEARDLSLADLFQFLPFSVFEKVPMIRFGPQKEEKFQFLYETLLEVPRLGLLKVVLIKKQFEEQEGIVLVSNRLEWRAGGADPLYKARWAIEVSYRDCKQHLGLWLSIHQPARVGAPPHLRLPSLQFLGIPAADGSLLAIHFRQMRDPGPSLPPVHDSSLGGPLIV